MKQAIAAVVIVLVLVGGIFALTRKSTPKNQTTNTPPSTTTSTTPTNNSTNQTSSTPASDATTITYTDNGFSPSVLTVKAGTVITIKNISSQALSFDSDPHPEHTGDPEINVGVILAGQSATVQVTVTGTHGYHNHFDASQTGTLVVN